ncbi:alpha-glucan family phosphorylase [bacterium]|nr:alpha-glucan family phosphorylase [bacterium]
MNILGTVMVRPVLPERIAGLQEISRNLWWSWNPKAIELFARLNEDLWVSEGHSPVAVLNHISQADLDRVIADEQYLAQYDEVYSQFTEYLNPKTTRFADAFPESKNKVIAYFSAEFGMHESLPIYSGGLGILSGDHLKTASDMGLPMVGIGLMYHHGYFIQGIDRDGWQKAAYKPLDMSTVPLERATDPNGEEIKVEIEMPGETRIYARVWKIAVGRITLYLLDTNFEDNDTYYRSLTNNLYGGDNNMRIAQEKVLGIGGVRALRRIGLQPSVWHMNEGHSAFLTLELMREYVEKGLNWRQAIEAMSPQVCFTTHTPVPAGQDAFDANMIESHFWRMRQRLGMSNEEFMSLGQNPGNPYENFNLTILALRLSRFRNGVSKLHGAVSRRLWRKAWPEVALAEVPITHVTNGVHAGTWIADSMAELFDKHLGREWRIRPDDHKIWNKAKLPKAELWQTHQNLKQKMINKVLECSENRLRRLGVPYDDICSACKVLTQNLKKETLTIGFARRFATYKRAVLLFSDIERLKRIMFAPGREINFVFAGKAHPADEPGQKFIKQIHDISVTPEFRGHIILLENYDIDMAKHLVQGVDVWLNNPRRPLEASGTSGEKAAMNGVLNFSVLDGWWAEGYNGKDGWAIGKTCRYGDNNEQDFADAKSLYDTLENKIVPAYYDNRDDEGIPCEWTDMMINSITNLLPEYSTHRMLHDYCHNLYIPAAIAGEQACYNNFSKARELTEWKLGLSYGKWKSVNLRSEFPKLAEIKRGQQIPVTVKAYLGDLRPEDVRVEVYAGQFEDNEIVKPQVVELKYNGYRDGCHCYDGMIEPAFIGSFAYAVRAVPTHSKAEFTDTLDFIRWSN